MKQAVLSFLNSIAYHVEDVPLDVDGARMTIDAWRAEGVDVPGDLTPDVLSDYHDDVLRARYPVSAEPLDPILDRAIYDHLHGGKYLIDDMTDDPIDYVRAWYTIETWRGMEEDPRNDYPLPFPAFMTPGNLMRWVNYHHDAKRKHDVIWIVSFDGGEEDWIGPFRSLTYDGMTPDDLTAFIATDSVRPDEFEILVPSPFDIRTRSDI